MARAVAPDFAIEGASERLSAIERLDREVERRRIALSRLDNSAADEIVKQYQTVLDSLHRNLRPLLRRIADYQQHGLPPTVANLEHWLQQEDRYLGLIRDLQERMLDFMDSATQAIEANKEEAVTLAERHVPDMAAAQAHGAAAPKDAEAIVRGSFNRLNRRWVDLAIQNTRRGTPLGDLISSAVGDDFEEAVRTELMTGVAQGKDVRDISRAINIASNLPLQRMLTIARTETHRIERQATHEMFKQSTLVAQWYWSAAGDERTCEVCWAEDGIIHPDSEMMESHVNCRCAMVPITKPWEELGFPGIEERPLPELGIDKFAALPSEKQLAILGRNKHAAYQRGDIGLEDLVVDTQHPIWGPGKRQATLKELGIKRMKPERPKASKDPLRDGEIDKIESMQAGTSSDTYHVHIKNDGEGMLKISPRDGIRDQIKSSHGAAHGVAAERISKHLGFQTPHSAARPFKSLSTKAQREITANRPRPLDPGHEIGLQDWLPDLEEPYNPPVTKEEAGRWHVLDFIIGNTDRHSGNWAVGSLPGGAARHLMPVDHDLIFPEHGKIGWGNRFSWVDRTGKSLTGEPLSDKVRGMVREMAENRAEWTRNLRADGLTESELQAMWERVALLLTSGKYQVGDGLFLDRPRTWTHDYS